jgi:fructose-specific component phosphotransferase system IIB-like protein
VRTELEGEQGRLAVGGLGDVERVEHDRPGAQEVGLGDERVHPGAAALRVAGVEVGDEQAERAVVVGDVEDADVGVVGREVVPLGEAQAVEPPGGAEDAVVQHALQLEVGAQGGGVDGEAFPAHALGEEGAVPGGDRVLGELVGLRRALARRPG